MSRQFQLLFINQNGDVAINTINNNSVDITTQIENNSDSLENLQTQVTNLSNSVSLTSNEQNGFLNISSINISNTVQQYSIYCMSTDKSGINVTYCFQQESGSIYIYRSTDALVTSINTNYCLIGSSYPSSSCMSEDVIYQTIVQGFSGFEPGEESGNLIISCNCQFGYIYNSSNSGENWTQTNAPYMCWKKIANDLTGKFQIALNYNSSSVGYVDTYNSIYQSIDYGNTWNIVDESNIIINNSNYAILDICMSSNGLYAYATVSEGSYNLNQTTISNVQKYIYYSVNDGTGSGFNTWSQLNTQVLYNLFSITTNASGEIIYLGTFNFGISYTTSDGTENNIGIFRLTATSSGTDTNPPIFNTSTLIDIYSGGISYTIDNGNNTEYEALGVLNLVTNNDGSSCYAITSLLTQTIEYFNYGECKYSFNYDNYKLFLYNSETSAQLLPSSSGSSFPNWNSICCSNFGAQVYASAILCGITMFNSIILNPNISYKIYAYSNCKIILPTNTNAQYIYYYSIINMDGSPIIICVNNSEPYLYGIASTQEPIETKSIILKDKYKIVNISSDLNGNYYFNYL